MKKNKLSNLIILTLLFNILFLISINLFYKHELETTLYKDSYVVNKLGKIRGDIQRYSKLKIINNKQYLLVQKKINSLFKTINKEFDNENIIIDKCKKNFLSEFSQLRKTWNKLVMTKNNKQIINLSEIAWNKSNIIINEFEYIHKLKFDNLIKNLNMFIYLSIIFLTILTIIVYVKIKKGLEIDIITDPLTQLYNRFFFNKQYEYLIEKYKRFKTPFSMIIIDIDNFKQINDTYGHKKGDKILQEVANTIKDSIRRTDLAFRYGGEEMIVLLPDTELEKAEIIANRIKNAISQKIKINNHPVTVSAGVGTYNGEESSVFFKKVDQALYSAKRTGKNKVILAKS